MGKFKKYQIEFWLNDEAIDLKESEHPIIVPRVGDSVFIMMENPNAGLGNNYTVLEVRHMYLTSQIDNELKQKIMVDLEVLENNRWKSQK